MQTAEVSKVIGAQVEFIETGHRTHEVQETTSAVYHVVEGQGRSVIGENTVEWKQGDTFTVPAWHRYHHEVSAITRPFDVGAD